MRWERPLVSISPTAREKYVMACRGRLISSMLWWKDFVRDKKRNSTMVTHTQNFRYEWVGPRRHPEAITRDSSTCTVEQWVPPDRFAFLKGGVQDFSWKVSEKRLGRRRSKWLKHVRPKRDLDLEYYKLQFSCKTDFANYTTELVSRLHCQRLRFSTTRFRMAVTGQQL